MWIVDPRIGLLSVVVADDPKSGAPSKELVMIRGRSRRHLASLQAHCPSLADSEIVRSESGMDYPCRLVVSRSAWTEAMTTLAESLDTRNVKSSAHRNEKALGRDFVSAMHSVHAALARVKDEPPASPSATPSRR